MPEELRFDGRVVIVTGAGAGLGRAYALLFASRGANVVVNDLGGGRHGDGSSSKAADAVVNEIRQNGGNAVANYDSVLDGANIVKTTVDTFGRVDVIVNNAGILRDKSFAKMTDVDWDMIQDVHVKGAVKTTRAAWSYFVKQKYGRVILTASNSGLYGNFGQANYSSAKMGLVGLANTLAIEGGKRNIHTNVIIPTAGSRLTKDILPPDFFEELKPEYIAPIVFWLCHESCAENGSIIESALGWAGKCHLIRSTGCVLRQNVSSAVTPETVQANWSKVTDMSSAKHYDSIQEVTGELLNVVERIKSGVSLSDTAKNTIQYSYNYRDTILYALGVGATLPSELHYLYENHEDFSVVPTFFAIYGPAGFMTTSLLQDSSDMQIDLTNILHGEQYVEVHKPIPTEAKIECRFKVQDILDKGKGALVLVQYEVFDVNSDEKLATAQMSLFCRGAKAPQAKRTSASVIPVVDPPKRRPDASISQKICVDQAALYRLNGDFNPLHIDPNLAIMAGYDTPILHGLCSLGFSVRHVIQAFADGDAKLFKAVKARFAKPVVPGQTLRTDMWQNGNRIHFETYVAESGLPVVTGAYVDLFSVKKGVVKINNCSNEETVEIDVIYDAIDEFMKTKPTEAKKINAVFLYKITSGGKPKVEWTLDFKKGEIMKGQHKSVTVDTILTLEDKDLIEMALGKLNPQVAFMRGKLKISGNLILAQKLQSFMDLYKSKM